MSTHIKHQPSVLDNQTKQVQLVSRENPHTQGVAISWLVLSLKDRINPTDCTTEKAVDWLVEYENYPMDNLIYSLQTAIASVYPELKGNPSAVRQYMYNVLKDYYDRKC